MDKHENCQCYCGTVRFTVGDTPIIRAFCHCTICQRFNNALYADITVFRAGDIHLPDDNEVDFKAYRSPPVVKRGKCTACDRPAIEFIHIPVLPRLVAVPTANIQDEALIPKPSLHIFYDTRRTDIDDDLPKYSGYLQSQIAFGRRMIGGILHG